MAAAQATLIDHQAYPVEEFPDRYAERWEVETLIGEVETRLRGGPEVVLRSKSPDLVREEGYALLCVYQAIRHLIATAAENARIDPPTGSLNPRHAGRLPPRLRRGGDFPPPRCLTWSATSSTRSPTRVTCSLRPGG